MDNSIELYSELGKGIFTEFLTYNNIISTEFHNACFVLIGVSNEGIKEKLTFWYGDEIYPEKIEIEDITNV